MGTTQPYPTNCSSILTSRMRHASHVNSTRVFAGCRGAHQWRRCQRHRQQHVHCTALGGVARFVASWLLKPPTVATRCQLITSCTLMATPCQLITSCGLMTSSSFVLYFSHRTRRCMLCAGGRWSKHCGEGSMGSNSACHRTTARLP